MGVLQNLSVIALSQVVGGALKSVSGIEGGDVVVKLLAARFTDQSQKLTKALQEANERAWKAMEVALGGDSLWDKCKRFFGRAEDQAFREQVRAFLEVSPLKKVKPESRPILDKALEELRSARSKGLFTQGALSPSELAREAGAFAAFREPQVLLEAEWKAIDRLAVELREACPNLHRVLVSTESSSLGSTRRKARPCSPSLSGTTSADRSRRIRSCSRVWPSASSRNCSRSRSGRSPN
jgi:hypothetical protein